jgi:hypothetical protein
LLSSGSGKKTLFGFEIATSRRPILHDRENAGVRLLGRLDLPPEAGFAGREAHDARQNSSTSGRLLNRSLVAAAVKEWVRGGTRGSPTLKSSSGFEIATSRRPIRTAGVSTLTCGSMGKPSAILCRPGEVAEWLKAAPC